MNTHTKRACRRDAGFSFVELLVTIIIAGIAFAALVPVFVMAAKKSGEDNSRNVAVNIAQGRLEKIRGLQYDQILADATHLDDDTLPDEDAFAGGQFRRDFVYTSAAGSKTYWIDYGVSLYPSTATAGKEDYKQVQVRVSWAPSRAATTPQNSVTLRTIIYKQYAGPAILAPPRIVAPTELQDLISTDDIPYPDCVTDRAMTIEIDVDPDKAPTTLNVVVGIYSATGELIEQIPEAQVVRIDALNHWRATWTAPDSVNDGNYEVRAVAVSTSKYLGNNVSTEFQLELGAPDEVSGLSATPGDGQVQLDWVRPTAADVDHYEIYRSLTEAFAGDPIESDWRTVSYPDASLTNGQEYYYKVVAVDIFGQSSTGVVTSATPDVGLDTTPPLPPSNLRWSASGLTITLEWDPSPGDVVTGTETGLGDYYLYQAAAVGGPWTPIWHGAATFRPVTHAAYDQTMYYRVTARDVALNESASIEVAATSESADLFGLSVQNPLNQVRYVRVHSGSLGGPLVGTNTGWWSIAKNTTDSTNWSNLVVGKYYVEWSNKSDGSPAVSDTFTQLSVAPYTFRLY